MKVVASVFSWIGGVATSIIVWAYSIVFAMIKQDWVLVAIPIMYMIFALVILIWRQYATSHGSKIGCGVCTLLFCSVVGGILTLCIPDYMLY